MIVRLPAYWVSVSFLIAASVSAAAVAAGAFREDQRRYEAQLQQRLQLQVQPGAGPAGRIVDQRLRVLRPPQPLAAWSSGFDRGMSASWDFGPAGEESLPPYPGSGLVAIVTLDIETVLRVFGGVLAVLLGVWVVASDRASGWLHAEHVLSASQRPFQIARLLGVWLAVVMATGLWAAGTNALLVRFDLPSVLPWSLWPVVVGIAASYLLVMASVGLVAGSVARSEAGAQAVAIGLWAVWNFLGPQIYVAARAGADQASRFRFETEQRELGADLFRAVEDDFAAEVVRDIGSNVPPPVIDAYAKKRFRALEPLWLSRLEDVRRILDARRAEADALWAAQVSRWQVVSWWSPGFQLQWAIAESLGTGPSTAAAWAAAVRAHQRQLEAQLFDNRPSVHLRLWVDGQASPWMLMRHPAPQVSTLPAFRAPATLPASQWPVLIGALQGLVAALVVILVRARAV